MEEIGIRFEFKECVNILKSTGRKAKTLRELRNVISVVSEDSIFHHTYQYFLKERVLEYTNDFAHWAGESLEERSLAERLSNIDPYDSDDIDGVRRSLLSVIDAYLEEFPEPREAMPNDAFYFNETLSIVFPVGLKARNLAEFLMAMKFLNPGCIYYHFYEARTRVRDGVDDFSKWIEDVIGKPGLAGRLRAIDPFMHDIEGIRQHIIEFVEEEVRNDMEALVGVEQ